MKQLSFLLSGITLLALGNLAHGATITWTNTSGGNWSVANNWSPHQVPTNTDDVLITKPGTYTVTFDVINSYPATNANNLTLGAGGTEGLQTLLMLLPGSTGPYFEVNSLMQVTNGGMLEMTNSDLMANPLLIDHGGIFNGEGENLSGTLTVANGGVMNTANGTEGSTIIVTNGGVLNAKNDDFRIEGDVIGTTTVAKGGIMNVVDVSFDQVLMVTPGGVLNFLPSESPGITSSVDDPVINSGTITATNAAINIYNDIEYYGTLVNLPGGVINVQGSSTIGVNGSGYFVNQGSLIESSGPGTTLNFDDYFDNSQGTVTNLAGTLVLGTYQTNLAGIYYAAAGATNQFIAANNATPVTPGAPFVLAGNGQQQLIGGFLAFSNVAYPKLTLIADSLVIGPAFQGGTITNLALDGIELSNSLPVTGILTATNSKINGNFTIASGGVFTESNATTTARITVANGGMINASGGLILDNYSLQVGGWVVAHGGVVNLSGTVNVWSTLTNAGTVNISTATVSLFANPQGGIVNQAGGVLNFLGGGSFIYYNYGPEYFINRGAVVQNSPGVTNTITMLDFDTSQGTVTNLAGTLLLEYFQTNLAGTYFTAVGATIQFVGGTAAYPVSPGTPLVLGGSGSYQFISDPDILGTHGYLYLPSNVPANLSMQGGQLELGSNFQGGAITNLTIGGITLTNTLPVKGTLTASNSTIYGNFTVAGGGVFNAGLGLFYGSLTVANAGVLNASGVNMFGPLTVASGGVLEILHGYYGYGLVIGAPMTNSGTINITNSGILIQNYGPPSAQGSLINQVSGLINFGSDSTYLSAEGGGYEYIVNQGTIVKSAGTNYSELLVPNLTNSGAITVQSGFIPMMPFVTLAGGSLNAGLNSANDYGAFIVTSTGPALTGTQALAGAFDVILNNGYVPTNGTSFNVLSYGSFTGSFSSLGLPSAVNWQSNYGSTNFTLVAGSGSPEFGSIYLAGTNLIFNGTGGTAGSNYVVLVSTNVALPLKSWTALTTNKFDVSGQFQYTNHINPAKPRQFFIFKLP
jgi:hypothetical protein